MKKVIILSLVILLSITLILPRKLKHPQVLIDTELGSFVAEIYEKAAPITATNFLKHVKQRNFDNTVFFRTVTMANQPKDKIKIEVIQAGGVLKEKEFPPLGHETTRVTNILHENGTISMARAKPGTATSSFFICIGPQPELDFGGKRNPDGQGFAAFGKVIKGMQVVKKIHQSPCKGQSLAPPIKINSITQLKQ
jgi:peptidyl-prolyl cis-trans isomerase A (cyclophilin A)